MIPGFLGGAPSAYEGVERLLHPLENGRVALAVPGVAAALATGNPLWDALGTPRVGAVLMVIAVKARMAQADAPSGAGLVGRINAVEARVRERFPVAKWASFAPDLH